MTVHDTLSFAVASHAVRSLRSGGLTWAPMLTTDVHVTASRVWPQPDFVIRDATQSLSLAAEFKPPRQTKREYLTGLGQAIAYTRDFEYSALVVPRVADDGYEIANHIFEVIGQSQYDSVPLSLWTYDPSQLSATDGAFDVLHPLVRRTGAVPSPAAIADSFYAKWREASPMELARYVELLYDESRVPSTVPIRDRAFDLLWAEMVAGLTQHWGGQPRTLADIPTNKTAQFKNYRNFVHHIGWTKNDGALTQSGLDALHVTHIYGWGSSVFLDLLAEAVLVQGKHLVLISAISRFQDAAAPPAGETQWLDALELHLEAEGLLKRNPARHAVAVRGVARGFLKAEKQLWRQLGLLVPRGARVFHPSRGFIFDWERITALVAR